jgi:hypothetical protein
MVLDLKTKNGLKLEGIDCIPASPLAGSASCLASRDFHLAPVTASSVPETRGELRLSRLSAAAIVVAGGRRQLAAILC